MLPDPGEELFSSLLEEEERTPPDVFSDLSTVLLSMDLGEGWEGGGRRREVEEDKKRGKKGQRQGEGRARGGGRQERG